MLKKLFYIALVAVSLIFISTFCFATDNLQGMAGDAVNGTRNIVGGAENAIEGAANGIGNMVKDGTNSVENMGNQMTQGLQNSTTETSNESQTSNNSISGSITGSDDSGYTASRTSTGDSTFMGMGSTAWTWLILGIAAIAIVALVWYYSMQFTNKNNNRYE